MILNSTKVDVFHSKSKPRSSISIFQSYLSVRCTRRLVSCIWYPFIAVKGSFLALFCVVTPNSCQVNGWTVVASVIADSLFLLLIDFLVFCVVKIKAINIEVLALLGFYAALIGSWVRTFRESLLALSSTVKRSFGTDRLSRNVSKWTTNRRCVTSQKSEDHNRDENRKSRD